MSCTFLLLGVSGTRAQENSAEDTVREFYQKYTAATIVKNKRMTQAAMKPYFTAAMLRKVVNTRDSDVVLQAQDFELSWAENIVIVGDDDNEGAETQYFFVTLKGVQMSQKLRITAKWDENPNTGGWKISAIEMAGD